MDTIIGNDQEINDSAADAQPWMWCQICHRCYQDGEYRMIKGIKMCPYEKCTGLILINGWPWPSVRKMYPHLYPEIPQRGIAYPSLPGK